MRKLSFKMKQAMWIWFKWDHIMSENIKRRRCSETKNIPCTSWKIECTLLNTHNKVVLFHWDNFNEFGCFESFCFYIACWLKGVYVNAAPTVADICRLPCEVSSPTYQLSIRSNITLTPCSRKHQDQYG